MNLSMSIYNAFFSVPVQLLQVELLCGVLVFNNDEVSIFPGELRTRLNPGGEGWLFWEIDFCVADS